EMSACGRVVTLPGIRLPATGGYRVMVGRRRLTALLDHLAPDRIEGSDRFTLRWTGAWARSRGVPSVVVSSESLNGWLSTARVPQPARRVITDRLNARTAAAYDVVVCTTDWAAEEFRRIRATNLRRAPLGVDLTTFHPDRYSRQVRDRFATS